MLMVIAFCIETMVLAPLSVFADAGYDRTAPVLKQLTITNANNIDASKDMEVMFDLVEDGVGVTSIVLQFIEKGTGEEKILQYFVDKEEKRYPLYTGKNKVKLSFYDKRFFEDDYILDKIWVTDANGNYSYYSAKESSDLWKRSTTKIKVTSSPHKDRTAPKVNAIKIENADKLDVTKGVIRGTVNVVEDGVGISSVTLLFRNKEEKYMHASWYTHSSEPTGKELKTGTHVLEFEVDKTIPFGEYELVSVSASDLNCNRLYYSKESDAVGAIFDAAVWKNYTQKVSVAKSNYKSNFAPTIIELGLKNTKIVTPEVLTIPMTLKTDTGGVTGFSITLENEAGEEMHIFNFLDKPIYSGKNMVKFTISPFVNSGIYHIKYISIDSPSDKQTYYEGDSLKALLGKNNPSIEVKSAFDIAYYGATSNVNGAVSQINKMKDGQVAVLDYRNNTKASKKIFEAIAGKDKTVVFENEDIQWVFNGKTVEQSACKTIDLEVAISKQKGAQFGYPDDRDILYMKFANNGVLPGPAEMRINNAYLTEKYKVTSDLILTYYDKSSTILDENVECGNDGYAEFKIKHNSVYILSDKAPRLVAPKGVKTTCQKSSMIKVSWNKVAGAAGYDIYRSTKKNGSYKKVGTVNKGTTLSWTDKSVGVGKTYYYMVKAKSSDRKVKASYSSKVSRKVLPEKVTGLRVTANKKQKVSIRWNTVSKSSGYSIYMATSKNGNYKCIGNTYDEYTRYYTKTKLKKKKTYYFKVRAYKKSGRKKYYGSYSEIIKVKVK